MNATPPIELIEKSGNTCIRLGPGWQSADISKEVSQVTSQLKEIQEASLLVFEEAGLDRDDALVIALLLEVVEAAHRAGHKVELSALPAKLRKLLELSLAVQRQEGRPPPKLSLVERLGRYMLRSWEQFRAYMEFLGELLVALWKLIRGKAHFQWRDVWLHMQETGVEALPIVSIISLLVGMILGFVGGMQLQQFGASIFVVNLVCVAMAREMGCIMTGIIMSGRTGAAFAAQIGSMNVNEEVDALETLSLSPMEFLVLPRVLAMVAMMPLLTLYSILLGCLGGGLVALTLEITPMQFYHQMLSGLSLEHILVGLGKSFIFGILVAGMGCYYGLRSGRSSASVGQAATSAVVAGITWIIVVDAIAAMVLQVFEI